MKRATHTEAKDKRDKFEQFCLSENILQIVSSIKKPKRVSFLKNEFEREFNTTIPLSAVYCVMKRIRTNFEPEEIQQN